MARPSRAEMRAMAESSLKRAKQLDAAAAQADQVAADETRSPATRRSAAVSAPMHRGHAREYREDAAKLREGYLPGEDW